MPGWAVKVSDCCVPNFSSWSAPPRPAKTSNLKCTSPSSRRSDERLSSSERWTSVATSRSLICRSQKKTTHSSANAASGSGSIAPRSCALSSAPSCAPQFGKLNVMFPMISALQELRDAKAILNEEAQRLGIEPVPAGIMVEVPAAAVLAAQFAREADFFSIGTNDLTQYTLAMDRGHPKLAPQVDGLNPSVLHPHRAYCRARNPPDVGSASAAELPVILAAFRF